MDLYNIPLGLINNNYFWIVLFLILLFCHRLDISFDRISEKFLLSYLFLISLKIINLVSWKFIIIFSSVFYFAFLEFFYESHDDDFKFSQPLYYVFDYLYKLFFNYHYFGFLLSLFFICYRVKLFLGVFSYVFCFICFIHTMKLILNNHFQTLSMKELKNKMNSILSFEGYWHDKRLEDFAKILCYYEDRSFFERGDAFNLLSFSFFQYKYNRILSRLDHPIYEKKYYGVVLKYIVALIISIKKVFSTLYSIFYNAYKKLCKAIHKKQKIHSIRSFIRGYSTIEMQLIRTLALKDSYVYTYQRKVYEFIYSTIYFSSLKKSYVHSHYSNISEYRYYLLHLYILSAPTFINGTRYDNIFSLFKLRDDVLEITNEEFFIFCLGLANRSIQPSYITRYFCPIKIDINLLKYFCRNILDKERKEPDSNGTPLYFLMYEFLRKKAFPIVLYFDENMTLKEVFQYIENKFSKKGLSVHCSNMKYLLFRSYFRDDFIKNIDDGSFLDPNSNAYQITVDELKNLCNYSSFLIGIVYNVYGGFGKTVGEENGIKYYFHNNEKNIHIDSPHIHCSYSGETIRISLTNGKVLDNQHFKSPAKTRQAVNYVKDHKNELFEFWLNVVDKDNDFNKKILPHFEFIIR